jgi:hypothetical protein
MLGDPQSEDKMREPQDTQLAELLVLHEQLRQATLAWSRGADPGAEAEQLRRRALRINHVRYVGLIPAYQRLAADQGLEGEVDLPEIVNRLMVTDELFKSYEPGWLERGDLASMTAWLGDIYFQAPVVDLDGVDDVHGWRERLKRSGIVVTYSSGTSGRLSFVPRDLLTWRALSGNGANYSSSLWTRSANGYHAFDCLILGPRGKGLGLQGAGNGLARMATRTHYLFDEEVTADVVRHRTRDARRAGGQVEHDAAWGRALAFLREAEAERPLLLFGPPFYVSELCVRAAALPDRLRLPPESILVSGGGWKSFAGQRVAQEELLARASETLGIRRDHIIDTYSTVELNCVFMSCPEMRYHVPPLIEPVVLDQALQGTPGAEGSGLLGFLDPFAVSYPGFVITGDQGRLVRDRCRCGLSGWAITGEIRRAPNQQPRGCGGVMTAVMA